MKITIEMTPHQIDKICDVLDSRDNLDLIAFRADLLTEKVRQMNSNSLPNNEGLYIDKNWTNDEGETLVELLRAGKKIQMIKVIRRELGLGLKEAKDLVERYYWRTYPSGDYINPAVPGGPWYDFVKSVDNGFGF